MPNWTGTKRGRNPAAISACHAQAEVVPVCTTTSQTSHVPAASQGGTPSQSTHSARGKLVLLICKYLSDQGVVQTEQIRPRVNHATPAVPSVLTT